MKTNKLILGIVFILCILSVSVLADVTITEAVPSPSTVAFSDSNAVQVGVAVKVTNPGANVVTSTEVKAAITGPSSISDSSIVTLSNLASAQTQTANLVINFPRSAKPGSYVVTVTAKDVAANTVVTTTTNIVVNAAPLVEVSKSGSVLSTIKIKGEPGDENIVSTYSLRNTGNVDLGNVRLNHAFSSLKDDDDRLVILSFNPSSIASLAIGATANFNVISSIQSGFNIETLSGNLEVGSDQFTTKQAIPMSVEVRPLSCKASALSNNMQVEIVEPDDNDDFEYGDTIRVRVDVTNDGNDDKRIRVQASLYNLDKSKVIESDTQEEKIKENDEKSIFFTFSLSDSGLDQDTDLGLFVKAFERGNEDGLCAEDDLSLNFVVPDHKVQIESLNLNPIAVACGGTASLSATLKNIGSNNEQAVLKVENSALGISQQSTRALLSENRDDDNNAVFTTVRFTVPENAKAGSYPLDVAANYYGKVSLPEEQPTLTVTCANSGTSTGAAGSQTGNTGSSSAVAAAGSVDVTSGNTQTPYTGAAVSDKDFWTSFSTGSYKVPTSVWVLIDIVLVLGVISLLVFLFRRH